MPDHRENANGCIVVPIVDDGAKHVGIGTLRDRLEEVAADRAAAIGDVEYGVNLQRVNAIRKEILAAAQAWALPPRMGRDDDRRAERADQLLTIERPAGSSLATSVVDPKRLGSAGSE